MSTKLKVKELPNVTVIGATTEGGVGLPGSTELANGWQLRATTTQFENAAGENVELGIAPDIVVDMTVADSLAGKDSILEAALDLF